METRSIWWLHIYKFSYLHFIVYLHGFLQNRAHMSEEKKNEDAMIENEDEARLGCVGME